MVTATAEAPAKTQTQTQTQNSEESRKRKSRKPSQVFFELTQEEEAKKVQAAIPQDENGARYNAYKVTDKEGKGIIVLSTSPVDATGKAAMKHFNLTCENLTGGQGGFTLTPEKVVGYFQNLPDEERNKILAALGGSVKSAGPSVKGKGK